MRLLVGLGNPEAKYAGNRHNVGFMLIDSLIEAFSATTQNTKCSGHLFKAKIGTETALLLKPQTYMNRSGLSVTQAMQFYKLKPQDMTVFYDELDLPLGKVRIKSGGGNGGHNGLKSIDAQIGTHYQRVRIGICRPEYASQVSSYVLSDFASDEQQGVEKIIQSLTNTLPDLLAGRSDVVMNRVALDCAPPATEKPTKAE